MISNHEENDKDPKANIIKIEGKYRDMIDNLKANKIINTATQGYDIGTGIMISKGKKYNPNNKKEKKGNDKTQKPDVTHSVASISSDLEEILKVYQPDVNFGKCLEDLTNRGLSLLHKEIKNAEYITLQDFISALKRIKENSNAQEV